MFTVADRSNPKNMTDPGSFYLCTLAGLLLHRSSISSSELVWGLAGEPLWSFHPPAKLQHPNLGPQCQLLHILATPQRTAALGFAGGPVVCEGVPDCRANLRTRLVSFHQH